MVYSELSGLRVVVMGLGAHGGGAASARFFAEAGADVTVTDLRPERELRDGMAALADLPIRFVLGEHRVQDFRTCDVVIKNPAVPRNAPLLAEAPRIETDISVFLALCTGAVVAVTGTKGKSTTASVLHHLLESAGADSHLGGNITVSPLTFVRDLRPDSVTVLELSSFQLGDLHLTANYRSHACCRFAAVAVTNLLPDHQDYYPSMQAYAADKAIIFERPVDGMPIVLSNDDPFSRGYAPPAEGRVVRVSSATGTLVATSAGTTGSDTWEEQVLPAGWNTASRHVRRNAFVAGLLAMQLGVAVETVRETLPGFAGVPHRLERVGSKDGILFVNDSAATIQEAALAAVTSHDSPVHLIAGGSDKGLPLDRFPEIGRAARSIHLLDGSATDRIAVALAAAGVGFAGPYRSLRSAVRSAYDTASSGDVVLLSPGCASFGMFRNEFDRGDQFRVLVQEIIKE